MKQRILPSLRLVVPVFLALVCARSGLADVSTAATRLWYREPATQWVQALPVGNGRLGAMVFGGIETERLQLNEDTLWAGSPYAPSHPGAKEALAGIRKQLRQGDFAGAQTLVQERFMASPMTQAPYQTLGDLLISMPSYEQAVDYRRELDLDTAVATTEFTLGVTRYRRECFSSAADQVIVVRLSALRNDAARTPAGFSFSLALQTPQNATTLAEQPGDLVLSGINGGFDRIPGGLRFEARVRIVDCDGQVTASGSQLHVANAHTATLLISAATSYRSYKDTSGDPSEQNLRSLKRAQARGYGELLAAHIQDHQRLFRRVSMDLGHTPSEDRPTDERVRAGNLDQDPSLAALYFNYARYLLISCSRPGSQPANLQGLWADGLYPPWGSKYTININTEMNYWPAEVANLPECTEPLFAMIDDLSHTGAATARDHYGAGGWVAHHNTDLWRATGPIDGALWGMWPCGGAWLCQHLWEHYLYSQDREFLARSYPLMRGAAQFFLDTLVEEPTHHWLVTSPSISPENTHHQGVAVVAGPTMDEQIIRALFDHCIEASRLLGTDADFAGRLAATRARLAPNQIGAQGQLQEWLEDWDAQAGDQQHRHVSHLYGFFPGNEITLRGTPELARAVRKSLETRGDISTGWAIAWRLNLWARQQDAERAYNILKHLLSPERTYPNLFDAHPPFQIDGNFGGASGIAEMLLQSHAGEIELLPALPKAWPTGRVTGLRARGNIGVDVSWENGRLTKVTLAGQPNQSLRLRYRDKTAEIQITSTGVLTWTP